MQNRLAQQADEPCVSAINRNRGCKASSVTAATAILRCGWSAAQDVATGVIPTLLFPVKAHAPEAGHHCNVERAEYEHISGFLRGLLVRLDDRLRAKDLVLIAEFIDVGELGLALEQLADVLSEEETAISPRERADMLTLAERMSMGQRVPRTLEFCPVRPDQG